MYVAYHNVNILLDKLTIGLPRHIIIIKNEPSYNFSYIGHAVHLTVSALLQGGIQNKAHPDRI